MSWVYCDERRSDFYMMGMKLSKDRLGGGLLLIFFAVYGFLSQDIQLLAVQHDAAFTPRTLPYFLTIGGIGGAVWMIISPTSPTAAQFQTLRWSRLVSFLILMSVYGLTLRTLGFLPATSIFLACGFVMLGERSVTWVVGVSLFVAAGFWILMSFGLGVFMEPWPAFIGSVT